MNCQVCNTTIKSAQFCSNCQWPVSAIRAIADPTLGEAVLRWAQKKYHETTARGADSRDGIELPLTSSKKGSEKFPAERSGVSFSNSGSMTEPSFQSRMNAHMGGEDSQSLDSLRSELVALSRRIASTEDQRLSSETETSKLSQRSQVLEQDIQKVTKAVEDMRSFFNKQNQENQKLDNQWHSAQKTSENHDQQIQNLIREQQQQVAEINWLKSLLTNRHVGQSASTPAAMLPANAPMVINPDLSFAPEELDLLRDYNSNSLEVPSSLRDQSANVSIDEETFARLRDGNESNIAFKSDRKGNYLVITRGGYRYLVPNKQRKIITHIYAVTKAVYKCDGYSESYKDFRLIKPALVSEESIDCWKLSQQGILEFT
jgi:hypothetical protein